MKIGIDATVLALPFPSGTKEYVHNLLQELSALYPEDEYILFGPPTLSDAPIIKNRGTHQQANFRLVPFSATIPLLKRQVFLKLAVERAHVDVFHYLEPFGAFLPVHPHTITTVHDMNLSQTYPWVSRNFLRRLYCEPVRFGVLRSTSTIIVGTHCMKTETQSYLKRHHFTARVKVIPWGVDTDVFRTFTHISGSSNNLFPGEAKILRKRYFLAMGDFAPRKNVKNVFSAYRKYLQKNDTLNGVSHTSLDLKIVISSQKYLPLYQKLLDGAHLPTSKVQLYVNPSKEQLANMYACACAFLYPSLYEGFGMPILEAMACGCPVITSNFGAMKEVAGGAAVLVDPTHEVEICQAMIRLEKDVHLRTDIIHAGLAHVKKYSWSLNAQHTHQEYVRALNKA